MRLRANYAYRAKEPEREVLEPGASIPLLGPDALRPGRDVQLVLKREPGATVKAQFILIEGGGSRVRLASPYFKLNVAR